MVMQQWGTMLDISPPDPQPSARDTQGVAEVRAPYRDAILYLGSGTVPLTSDNTAPWVSQGTSDLWEFSKSIVSPVLKNVKPVYLK